jgi:hypothetical protein
MYSGEIRSKYLTGGAGELLLDSPMPGGVVNLFLKTRVELERRAKRPTDPYPQIMQITQIFFVNRES